MAEVKLLSAEEVAAMRRRLDSLDALPPRDRLRTGGRQWLTTPEYERVVVTLEAQAARFEAREEEVRRVMTSAGGEIGALKAEVREIEARAEDEAGRFRQWEAQLKAERDALKAERAELRQVTATREEWCQAFERRIEELQAERDALQEEVARLTDALTAVNREVEVWMGRARGEPEPPSEPVSKPRRGRKKKEAAGG